MINLPTLGKLNNAFYKALSAIIISSTLLITGCGSGSDDPQTRCGAHRIQNGSRVF